MTAKEQVDYYLEYCKYRKELDEKTLKAYRIDLKQYFDAVSLMIREKRKLINL